MADHLLVILGEETTSLVMRSSKAELFVLVEFSEHGLEIAIC